MADAMEFDFTDILKLAADLGEVPDNAGKNIRKAIEVTARHVRDDWREPLQGSATVPIGPAAVTYDLAGGNAVRGSQISAEIGPELKGQGAIVGMLEYGTPRNSPRGFGAAALQKNEADFINGLTIALDQAEKQAGL